MDPPQPQALDLMETIQMEVSMNTKTTNNNPVISHWTEDA